MHDRKSNVWVLVGKEWQRQDAAGRLLAIVIETPHNTWIFKDSSATFSYTSLARAKDAVEKHW